MIPNRSFRPYSVANHEMFQRSFSGYSSNKSINGDLKRFYENSYAPPKTDRSESREAARQYEEFFKPPQREMISKPPKDNSAIVKQKTDYGFWG
jgi:hypothetical protein